MKKPKKTYLSSAQIMEKYKDHPPLKMTRSLQVFQHMAKSVNPTVVGVLLGKFSRQQTSSKVARQK